MQRDAGAEDARSGVDADPAGSEPPEGARDEKMNIRSKMIFGGYYSAGDYYERIVFSGGNNRWSSSSRRFRLSFFLLFFISLLFRRWRCNQIARPIPRIGLRPDLRGWIGAGDSPFAVSAVDYCDTKMEK